MTKIAFVFPGQGSQSVGMLDSWLAEPGVNELLEQADSALDAPISQLIAQGPEEDLNLTINTQPAMLLAAVLMYQQWQQAGGPVPAMMAGHSLGEYSALTAAQSLKGVDSSKYVRNR